MNKKLTVSQLNRYIRGVFEDELILHGISVEGEIFEFKAAGGNSYIILSEGGCTLNCVYFSSVVPYAVGAKICASGSVEFYPKGGRLSFVIKNLRLCGEGELAVRKKILKDKLLKEGIFENNRKLKPIIKSIALITSGEGAVLHDFYSVINRLAPYVDIKVFPVKVQGVGAASEIAHTVSDITCENNLTLATKNKFDVIVIARGGGSAVDLDEFNAEGLARAIHQSPITVVSAVGHETDYTLCDLSADIRAGTPSIAAEIIANNNALFLQKFYNVIYNISAKTVGLLNQKNRSLIKQNEKSIFYALDNINSIRRKIVKINYSFQSSIKEAFISRQKSLLLSVRKAKDILLAQLNARESEFKVLCAEADKLSPLKILNKGYARIIKNDEIMASVKSFAKGDSIEIVMSDGDAVAEIKSVKQRK